MTRLPQQHVWLLIRSARVAGKECRRLNHPASSDSQKGWLARGYCLLYTLSSERAPKRSRRSIRVKKGQSHASLPIPGLHCWIALHQRDLFYDRFALTCFTPQNSHTRSANLFDLRVFRPPLASPAHIILQGGSHRVQNKACCRYRHCNACLPRHA